MVHSGTMNLDGYPEEEHSPSQMVRLIRSSSPPVACYYRCPTIVLTRGELNCHFGTYFALRLYTATAIQSAAFLAPRAPSFDACLAETGARIAIIQALCLAPDLINAAALRHPQTLFVLINHSSPSFTGLAGDAEKHWRAVEVSRSRPNVLYVVIDDRIPLLHERMVLGGNPVRPLPFSPLIASSHARVSVSGRSNWSKGHFQAIEALAYASREFGLNLSAVGSTSQPICDAAKRALSAAGVPWVWSSMVQWEDYPMWIGLMTDVTLQPTMTESFGLVALEHMLVGRPCIGTRALRYLPEEWTVNDPDDVRGFANALDHLLTHPLDESAIRAREIAEEVATDSEGRFAAMADRIMCEADSL